MKTLRALLSLAPFLSLVACSGGGEITVADATTERLEAETDAVVPTEAHAERRRGADTRRTDGTVGETDRSPAGLGPIEVLRRDVVQSVFGEPTLPRVRPVVTRDVAPPVAGLANLARADALETQLGFGLVTVGHLLVPAERKRDHLVVFHGGHACSFEDDAAGTGYRRSIAALVDAGYTVAVLPMPAMWTTPDGACLASHGDLFALPVEKGSALRLFVEPVLAAVNHGMSHEVGARRVSMVGLSGGGWTTILYAAMDTRVTVSLPVAGSLPLALRAPGSNQDEEQVHAAFYDRFSYEDLYVLGAFGKGRRQLQILNRRDDCCFGEAPTEFASSTGLSFDQEVRGYEARVHVRLLDAGGGGFGVVVDETATQHQISPWALADVLLPALAGEAQRVQ